jgi:hypothetical protein
MPVYRAIAIIGQPPIILGYLLEAGLAMALSA